MGPDEGKRQRLVTAGGIRRRLASIGPGCTVGEMGLLNTVKRSADVRADDEVHAYELSVDSYRRILSDSPHVGHAVLTGIARQLSDRLRVTSEELRLIDD
jgi:CRP-like cAMP-binding protein